MKKQYLILLALLPIVFYAGTVTKTLNFSTQDLTIQQIGDYSLVGLKGMPSYQIPGSPTVPVAVYNVLVPATASVTEIRVISKQEQLIPGSFYLYPAQEPRPISYTGEMVFTNPNPSVYNSHSVYPENLTDFSSTGTKSGYRVASFVVYPVQYIPSEHKLSLVTSITLQISYEENKVSEQALTASQKSFFSQDVKGIVINKEDITKFEPQTSVSEDNEIDCVIITNDALSSNFQPLVEWHNKKGFRTEVKTTTAIQTAYAGRDVPEKIRNFIIDYFNTRGLKWVILGGDNTIIPGRRARAVVGSYTGNIPCDLYFADLQWSWDGNNNSVFGEVGYDTVDFFADLYVGRLSVENASEITNNINKIFTYEKNPDSTYLKKILLPAAYLWDNYNHMLSQDSIFAMTPPGWIAREINLGQNDGLRYLDRDSLNNGFGLAHLVGHGDDVGIYINYSAQYNTSDPATQTNSNKLAIVNSIACYPGNFEYSDCLAERMMNAQNCAVAVMMNSRYGWGTPPVLGPSELLDMRFFDFFFNLDSSVIGSCFSTSKDAYRYMAESQQVWRWCVFELNLFGDPVMPMWKDTPGTVEITRPDTIMTGLRTVQVSASHMGLPLSNVLIGIYKPGEVYARGMTDATGQVSLLVNALTPGKIYITASGKNCYPKEDSSIVTPGAAAPYITLNWVNPVQVNPNQNINLNVMIKNLGTASATNTTGKIRTASSYIILTDSTSSYGTVLAGDSAIGDMYSFYVSSTTPSGTQIPFMIKISADQDSWNYNFNITCGQALPPGQILVNHDTGYCSLSVTAQGNIGYTAPNEKIGSGFRYPKSAISALYYSSMMAGNSDAYIVDRFYGQPSTSVNQDWSIVDSLRFVLPPIFGHQHLRCSYNDAGHTAPKGLKVTQNSYSSSDSRYDDFVVLEFEYQNTGASAINGLYSGIIADFDIPPDSSNIDIAGSDATRRMAYMRRAAAQNPTAGIKLLYPTTARNLTAVDHDLYVYPSSAMTELMKYQILNSTINQPTSNRTYDWSVAVSNGPFDLAPSQTYKVAYAFVGGTSEATLFANADSAQIWYDRLSGIADETDLIIPGNSPMINFSLAPNPTVRPVQLAYNILTPGHVTIGLYDVTGQLKSELFNGDVKTLSGRMNFRLNNLPNGVYFVKLATGNSTVMKKLLLVK